MRAILNRLPFGNLLTSSGLLIIGMTIVNAGNYLFNLLLGRWLGPADFADLSLIITLFLVMTFVTSAFQTVAAKYAATYTGEQLSGRIPALHRWLSQQAWRFGMLGFAIFSIGAPFWASFFQIRNAWLFVIFAIGIPFYFAQGVDRGMIQGQTRFGVLAISYQIEMWVRLICGCGLVLLGLSVQGGVIGLTVSIIATWLFSRTQIEKSADHPAIDDLALETRIQIRAFALPVVLGLVGQIIINNSDILVVKRFFDAESAGSYAALALMGRIVFFATWSVVTMLFPLVAQHHQRGESHRHLLAMGLGLVGSISLLLIAASIFAPTIIIQALFSNSYISVAPLLWLYAGATAVYALANVIITYHLSIGHGFGSVLALIAGGLQVTCLILVHTSLLEVVLVQFIVLSALLVTLLLWDSVRNGSPASMRRFVWGSRYSPD